jgi:hypothetical protein
MISHTNKKVVFINLPHQYIKVYPDLRTNLNNNLFNDFKRKVYSTLGYQVKDIDFMDIYNDDIKDLTFLD